MHYIFVHGLSGWGSYDESYRKMPYWGMFGGDLIQYLRERGFSCFAASVAPEGSAWDRACELYAQLSGTRVDYGKAHSERCHHARYGRDFSDDPLIPDWNDGEKLVLFGHSFGGATIRLFSQLLAHGCEKEREATEEEDLSPLFRGGQEERLCALVTLAAPTNGTTAYDLHNDPNFDVSKIKVPFFDNLWGNFFSGRKSAAPDGRVKEDYAAFDMHIDNALSLNKRISTLPGVFYFAVPCSATKADHDGIHHPIRSIMEPMFRRSSLQMGHYSGVTAGGFEIDSSWRENDGLVNTASAKAPFGAPFAPYDPEHAKPGVWQIMPTFHGDHMSLQGGMMKKTNIRPFYLELISTIETLARG